MNCELVEAAKLREEVEMITRHDLKNPLTGIIWGVDLIELDGNLNAEQIDAAQMIRESAGKMLKMINSSPDLFNMERNIYRVKTEDVDVIQLFTRLEKDLGALMHAGNTGIRIITENTGATPDDSFTVKGESLLIYSMMANLVKNDGYLLLQASPGKRIQINPKSQAAI